MTSEICWRCGGSEVYPATCHICRGAGRKHNLALNRYEMCVICHGQGYLMQRCITCGGTGKIERQ